MKRKGKIIPNGVVLRPHELMTVVLLTDLGLDVELIPKINREGAKSPDIKIQNLLWEIKAPKGGGKWVIKKTVQRASHQAENIIVDLRRSKIHEDRCLSEIERYFKMSKRIKRVKVITKARKIVDFSK